MRTKRILIALSCAVILTAFTGYVLLDTFVIPRAYAAEVTQESSQTADLFETYANTGSDEIETDPETETEYSSEQSDSDYSTAEAETEQSVSTEPVITDSSYSDGNISITINEYEIADTSVYVADVQVSSTEYLKTAFADGLFGKNITAATSETAGENDAILAINGDYYGARETGYVLRNGIIYRDSSSDDQEDLVIYADGSFEIINESETSLSELADAGAWQVLSFGPALIENGEISVSEDEEVGKAKSSNPRTAIGIIDELHYVFVVSDGRTNESEGLSLAQLAEVMQELGCTTAYNLDGGGSSTMYFNGNVINNPTTNGNKIKERSVSDIVYIG